MINVLVIIQRVADGSGNAGDGDYEVTCNPPDISVTRTNTLINYQLLSPTPAEIVLTGFTTSKPIPIPQLSQPPSISLDGTLMTLCDANTVAEEIHITLGFQDNLHERKLSFDPQVTNVPE